jgi:hypothetical protein
MHQKSVFVFSTLKKTKKRLKGEQPAITETMIEGDKCPDSFYVQFIPAEKQEQTPKTYNLFITIP